MKSRVNTWRKAGVLMLNRFCFRLCLRVGVGLNVTTQLLRSFIA